MTLRELEFENLENLDPEVSAPGEIPLQKKKKRVGFCLPAAETHLVETLQSRSVPEQIIESFCSTIRNITEMCTCAGVLVSNNIKHRVWVPRAPLAHARVVPLAKLLSLSEPPMMERLKLAVRLASSVLQFHTSGWLQEKWGKQDIYLIQRGASQSGNPSLEMPVVLQAFTPEPTVQEASIESRIIRCNLSLFSLGIVLIELWYWKNVESFHAGESQVENLDIARYITVQELIEKFHEVAGIDYSSSVRRCIRGIDHQETQLENNDFKNEVYVKVLQPLEKHLEHFSGKPLGELFKK